MKKIENPNKINAQILKALNWRYAVKTFDPNKKVSKEDIQTILESARLSPSSMGVEMWKFIVVKNKKKRKKLREAGYNQPKITDASHLIVIAYRIDGENIIKERLKRTAKIQKQKLDELFDLQNMLETSIIDKIKNGNLESWAKMQAYIPLGIMIMSASILGIDNCPMEGFENDKVDEILNLKRKNLKSITMLALGYRGKDIESTKPKVRRNFNEVIQFI